MTLLIFLLDTSASMAQSSYQGLSYIDHARYLVSMIRKKRDTDRMGDRFMLLTTEDFPKCVKAGFREGSQVFDQQLSGLRAKGNYHVGHGVLNALRYLAHHRATFGADNYGHGRYINTHSQNDVVIITITDSNGASEVEPDFQLVFPDKQTKPPGAELTEEAFRWDQRVYSVVLRLPSSVRPIVDPKKIESEVTPIDRMCGLTGGRSFSIYSHEQMSVLVTQIISCISILGGQVRFESAVPAQKNGQKERTLEERKQFLGVRLETRPLSLVYAQNRHTRGVQVHWPIPESFYPQLFQESKTPPPPRTAHPVVTVSSEHVDAGHVFQDFAFDKYEVEAGPLTEYILEKQNAGLAWHLYVKDSGKDRQYGKPFGYLKASSTLNSVSMYIMPYNYPALQKLLEEQRNDPRMRNNPMWKSKLEKYMDSVPNYYLAQLRKNLQRIQIMVDDPGQNGPPLYNYHISNIFTRIKHTAKEEQDAIDKLIAHGVSQPIVGYAAVTARLEKLTSLLSHSSIRFRSDEEMVCEYEKRTDNDRERSERERREVLRDPDEQTEPLQPQSDGTTLTIIEAITPPTQKDSFFRNPFLLNRQELLSSLPRLRANFEQSITDSRVHVLQGGLPGTIIRLENAEELHSQPISTMSVYEEYMKCLQSTGLRPREVEPKETGFGNPFKMKSYGGVDEVMEGPNTAKENQQSRKDRKSIHEQKPARFRRKPGPLEPTAMTKYRERRRTISDRSSVVSDLSYISSLDMNDVGVNDEQNVTELNGLTDIHVSSPGTSGLNNGTNPDKWGYEEEFDEVLPCDDITNGPPSKRARLEEKTDGERRSDTQKDRENGKVEVKIMVKEGQRIAHRKLRRLSHDEVKEKMRSFSTIVRRIPAGRVQFDDIMRGLHIEPHGTLPDRFNLLLFAIREAERFKIRDLLNKLQTEANKLEAEIETS